jgi:hypothetical protein
MRYIFEDEDRPRYERKIPEYLEGSNPEGKRGMDKIKNALIDYLKVPKDAKRSEMMPKINSNKRKIQSTLKEIYREVKKTDSSDLIEVDKKIDIDDKIADNNELSNYDIPEFGQKSERKLKNMLLGYYSKFLYGGDDLSFEQKRTISSNKKGILDDIADYISMHLWIDEEGEKGNWGIEKINENVNRMKTLFNAQHGVIYYKK